MISFKDRGRIVEELVAGLLHATVPTSWNLVLPPVFDETEVVDEVANKLRLREPAPLVAVVSSDMIKTPLDYVRSVHEQWGQTVKLAALTSNSSPDSALHRLLMAVPSERPAVQILKRFHKILDAVDQWVLGSMRNAEQAGKLRSLVIAPYDYEELKRRWERRGKLLIASDYGDAHSLKTVELPSEKDVASACEERTIPRHIVEFALRQTGGYPVPFRAVVEEWVRRGRPPLRSDTSGQLRATAEQRMAPLVRQLDVQGESRYRSAILDLYQGADVDDALDVLGHHPWRDLLLAEDGVRAEALGRAVADSIIREAVDGHSGVSMLSAIMGRAAAMYRRRQYRAAMKVIETHAQERYRTGYMALLHAHAGVMATLYCSEGEEPSGVDTDWRGLRSAVQTARRVLAAARSGSDDFAEIERRYDDLDGLARSVLEATKDGKPRVVDILSGCADGRVTVDARTALLLLLLKLESSRSISGDASACQAILALPEQIFRVWAMWFLRLSYYRVPEGHEDIWKEVEEAWPHGQLVRAVAGGTFGSFELFAYFAIAMSLQVDNTMSVALPEQTLKDLTHALSTLDVRRDAAHALTIPNRRARTQLFALVDRWFDTLLGPCPAHPEGCSREELLARVEPLPLVGEDGIAAWQ